MYDSYFTTTDDKDYSPVVFYALVGRRCASISFLQLPPIVTIRPGLPRQQLVTLLTKVFVFVCGG